MLKPIVGEIKAQVLNDNFSYINQKAEDAGLDPRVDDLIARIGNNEDLDTTEKSKIILAINEIYQDLVSHKAETAKKHIHSSGSNSDGEWIRFDDGTQICSYVSGQPLNDWIDRSTEISFLAWGDKVYMTSFAFPMPFIEDPTSLIYGGRVVLNGTSVLVLGRNWSEVILVRDGSFPGGTFVTVNLMAIGRWK